MKKSQKFLLLQIAAAYNKAQENNDTMPFYSENPGMAGFRYLDRSVNPYAAFSPTLFDKAEEIDEDDLNEIFAAHVDDKTFPEEYACYELTDKQGNIAQVVVDIFYLPDTYEICDFILENDTDHKDLKREEITEGVNGYPRNCQACITGFTNYAEAEDFADTYGLEVYCLRRRNGQDFWNNLGPILNPIYTVGYMDTERYLVFHSYLSLLDSLDDTIAEYKDMAEDDPALFETIAQLRKIYEDVELLAKEGELPDNKIIYYDTENPADGYTIDDREKGRVEDYSCEYCLAVMG